MRWATVALPIIVGKVRGRQWSQWSSLTTLIIKYSTINSIFNSNCPMDYGLLCHQLGLHAIAAPLNLQVVSEASHIRIICQGLVGGWGARAPLWLNGELKRAVEPKRCRSCRPWQYPADPDTPEKLRHHILMYVEWGRSVSAWLVEAVMVFQKRGTKRCLAVGCVRFGGLGINWWRKGVERPKRYHTKAEKQIYLLMVVVCNLFWLFSTLFDEQVKKYPLTAQKWSRKD